MPHSRHLGATPDMKRRELAAKLRAERLSLRQIGERLNVSKQAASILLHRAGIGTGPARQAVMCKRCNKPAGPGTGLASKNRYSRIVFCVSCVAKDRAASFGLRVRAASVAAGLTIAELAKRVGLGESSFLNLDWSRKHPKPKLVRRVADALDLNADEFVHAWKQHLA